MGGPSHEPKFKQDVKPRSKHSGEDAIYGMGGLNRTKYVCIIHTYIRIYIRVYIHTFIHTYVCTCIHTCMHACIRIYIHMDVYTYSARDRVVVPSIKASSTVRHVYLKILYTNLYTI